VHRLKSEWHLSLLSRPVGAESWVDRLYRTRQTVFVNTVDTIPVVGDPPTGATRLKTIAALDPSTTLVLNRWLLTTPLAALA